MPKTCTLCGRSDRDKVDQAVRSGATLRAIANQFGTSHSTVLRHSKHVLKNDAANASKVPLPPEVTDVEKYNFVQELLTQKTRAINCLDQAEKEKNHVATIQIMREIRATIETIIKVALAQRELEQKELDIEKGVKDISDEILEIVNRGINFSPDADDKGSAVIERKSESRDPRIS